MLVDAAVRLGPDVILDRHRLGGAARLARREQPREVRGRDPRGLDAVPRVVRGADQRLPRQGPAARRPRARQRRGRGRDGLARPRRRRRPHRQHRALRRVGRLPRPCSASSVSPRGRRQGRQDSLARRASAGQVPRLTERHRAAARPGTDVDPSAHPQHTPGVSTHDQTPLRPRRRRRLHLARRPVARAPRQRATSQRAHRQTARRRRHHQPVDLRGRPVQGRRLRRAGREAGRGRQDRRRGGLRAHHRGRPRRLRRLRVRSTRPPTARTAACRSRSTRAWRTTPPAPSSRPSELCAAVDRPNVLIKIPATVEGLPAITEVLAEGISVNVTLIFSLDRYRGGDERVPRPGSSRPARPATTSSRIHSVASFFVSRVDTEIDKRLDAIGTDEAAALKGKAGRRQRPAGLPGLRGGLLDPALGARSPARAPTRSGRCGRRPESRTRPTPTRCTSTELVAPGTVNTMPEQDARRHRRPRRGHRRHRDAALRRTPRTCSTASSASASPTPTSSTGSSARASTSSRSPGTSCSTSVTRELAKATR